MKLISWISTDTMSDTKEKMVSYESMKDRKVESDRDINREKWASHCEFFLTCLGYAVGVGNVWRFPYLCYKNGGGSFLIPYLVMLAIFGLPAMFFELSLGQYFGVGPAKLFGSIRPWANGIGWAMAVTAFLFVIYYNMIIAWTIFYIFSGFTSNLPWARCPVNGSKECFSLEQDLECIESSNSTQIFYGGVCTELLQVCSTSGIVRNGTFQCEELAGSSEGLAFIKRSLSRHSASEEFFTQKVLGLRPETSWSSMGSLQPHLVISLGVAWILVFLCMVKGIRSSGKVVYFSAIYPFIILGVLFARGVTLPGAWEGIAWYISPDWEKLFDIHVWGDAATQLFYSLGMCCGSLLTIGSYNSFNNNSLRDATIVSIINCATSIFSGFAIFSIVGFMAHHTGVSVPEVIQSGPGLAFIAYPLALSYLPLPSLWSFLFFTMLLCLGFDTQFSMVEAVTTAVMDQWPGTRRHVSKVVATTCVLCFLLGLPFCLQGGVLVFELFNVYTALLSLLVIGFLELVLVSWLYPLHTWLACLREMGVRVGWTQLYWTATWKYFIPGLVLVFVTKAIFTFEAASYAGYSFPLHIQMIGWALAIIPLLPVPICALIEIRKDFRLKIVNDFEKKEQDKKTGADNGKN